MKRFCVILLLALSSLTTSYAQSVIIGEKLPDMNLRKYLMDFQPEQTPYTCYLFYHSKSELCKRSLTAIKPLIKDTNAQLGLVIITKEEYEDAGVTLTEHLDDYISVAFDLQGRAFRSVNVNFIPFCIICDHKRRVLWCGNAATLTQNVLDKILTTK